MSDTTSPTRPAAERPDVENRSAGALADLRVLELGSMLAGPFVGTMLADFGADVIKVEKPGKPDALREWPPHKGDVPLWWKTMSRGKRLVSLDISRPEARETALRLIGKSDIVIENFKPGTLERWGLDPAKLAQSWPKIVWVRVSGYGQTGPIERMAAMRPSRRASAGLPPSPASPRAGRLSPPSRSATISPGSLAHMARSSPCMSAPAAAAARSST